MKKGIKHFKIFGKHKSGKYRVSYGWWDIHTGRGYDRGDGVDIYAKVLTIFGLNIFLKVEIETNQNKWALNIFGYKVIHS